MSQETPGLSGVGSAAGSLAVAVDEGGVESRPRATGCGGVTAYAG